METQLVVVEEAGAAAAPAAGSAALGTETTWQLGKTPVFHTLGNINGWEQATLYVVGGWEEPSSDDPRP